MNPPNTFPGCGVGWVVRAHQPPEAATIGAVAIYTSLQRTEESAPTRLAYQKGTEPPQYYGGG